MSPKTLIFESFHFCKWSNYVYDAHAHHYTIFLHALVCFPTVLVDKGYDCNPTAQHPFYENVFGLRLHAIWFPFHLECRPTFLSRLAIPNLQSRFWQKAELANQIGERDRFELGCQWSTIEGSQCGSYVCTKAKPHGSQGADISWCPRREMNIGILYRRGGRPRLQSSIDPPVEDNFCQLLLRSLSFG